MAQKIGLGDIPIGSGYIDGKQVIAPNDIQAGLPDMTPAQARVYVDNIKAQEENAFKERQIQLLEAASDLTSPENYLKVAAHLGGNTESQDAAGNVIKTPNLAAGIKMLDDMGFARAKGINPPKDILPPPDAGKDGTKKVAPGKPTLTPEQAKKELEQRAAWKAMDIEEQKANFDQASPITRAAQIAASGALRGTGMLGNIVVGPLAGLTGSKTLNDASAFLEDPGAAIAQLAPGLIQRKEVYEDQPGSELATLLGLGGALKGVKGGLGLMKTLQDVKKIPAIVKTARGLGNKPVSELVKPVSELIKGSGKISLDDLYKIKNAGKYTMPPYFKSNVAEKAFDPAVEFAKKMWINQI